MAIPNLLTFPTSRPGPSWVLINYDNPLSFPVMGQFDPEIRDNPGGPIWQTKPGIAGGLPWLKFTGRNLGSITIRFLAISVTTLDLYPILAWKRIQELATVDEIFSDPRHPYTQGLLQALPATRRGREPLYTIPGRVPPPQFTPPGCYFAPRCPHAIERCWEARPELEVIGTKQLRCFNSQDFVRT